MEKEPRGEGNSEKYKHVFASPITPQLGKDDTDLTPFTSSLREVMKHCMVQRETENLKEDNNLGAVPGNVKESVFV